MSADTTTTSMWGIHAGGPRSTFLSSGVILLWSDVGDVHGIGHDRDELKRRLSLAHPDAKAGALPVHAGVLLLFAYGPDVGDVVVHPERASRTVSIGRIDSDYFFEEPDHHCRHVTWLLRRYPRDKLSDVARKEVSSRRAFFALHRSIDKFLALVPAGKP